MTVEFEKNMPKPFTDKIIFILLILFIIFLPVCELINYRSDDLFAWFLLGIILFLSLSKQKFNISKYFFSKNTLFFWAYLLLASLNVWFAQDKNIAFSYYKFLGLTSILIFFTFRNEINRDNIEKIFYVHCVCAAIVSVIGFIEMFLGSSFIYENYFNNYYYTRYLYQHRMMSTLVHPIILGQYLVTALPLAYYFYKSAASWKMKSLNFIVLFVITLALICTFSRGAWLAFICVFSLWFLIEKKFWKIAVMWSALLFFIFFVASSFVAEDIMMRFSRYRLFSSFNYWQRIVSYSVAFAMLKAHPLIGIGFGNFRMLFDKFSGLGIDYEFKIPESIYLMHLAEAGILGFMGFFLFLGNIIRQSIRRYKELCEKEKKLFLAFLMSFTAILINMAFYDGFMWRSSFYLFWVFAAVISGIALTRYRAS